MIGEKAKMVDGKFTFEMPGLPREMMAFRIIDPDAIKTWERMLGVRREGEGVQRCAIGGNTGERRSA